MLDIPDRPNGVGPEVLKKSSFVFFRINVHESSGAITLTPIFIFPRSYKAILFCDVS